MKKCATCKQIKPLSEFHLHKREKDGHQTACKNCRSAARASDMERNYIQGRKYYLANKDTLKKKRTERYIIKRDLELEKRKIYNTTHKEQNRNRRFMRVYGISLQEYNQILEKQNSRCAICRDLNENGKMLCVDHNHLTGKIRGLLCNSCNKGIGYFSDDPKILESARGYLVDHQRL